MKNLFFSRQDVNNAAELCARCFVSTGVMKRDVFQNMMTYGMFTGALVTHYGAEKVGCLVIPAGPGNSERQVMLMRDFGTTVIHITPSYGLYLATFLEKHGVNPRRDLKLRKAFVGAEPYTEETRRKIEQGLGLDVYNSYGLSEMNGPSVAFECEHKTGSTWTTPPASSPTTAPSSSSKPANWTRPGPRCRRKAFASSRRRRC